MSIVVYLDLDRTLYDTDRGGQMIWQELGRAYPHIDAVSEHASQQKYYVYQDDGDAYAYDFGAHMDALGLVRDEVYAMLRGSDLADERLEYDGVSELVTWIQARGKVRVLTYGTDDYQRLKAALCPSLVDVEIITTRGDKAEYLADKGDVWLVDDRPLGDMLPSNVRFIQVLVDETVSQGRGEVTWLVVYSLADATKILQNNR